MKQLLLTIALMLTTVSVSYADTQTCNTYCNDVAGGQTCDTVCTK